MFIALSEFAQAARLSNPSLYPIFTRRWQICITFGLPRASWGPKEDGGLWWPGKMAAGGLRGGSGRQGVRRGLPPAPGAAGDGGQPGSGDSWPQPRGAGGPVGPEAGPPAAPRVFPPSPPPRLARSSRGAGLPVARNVAGVQTDSPPSPSWWPPHQGSTCVSWGASAVRQPCLQLSSIQLALSTLICGVLAAGPASSLPTMYSREVLIASCYKGLGELQALWMLSARQLLRKTGDVPKVAKSCACCGNHQAIPAGQGCSRSE